MTHKTSSLAYLLPLTVLTFVLSLVIPYMWVVFLAFAAIWLAVTVAGLLRDL